MPAINDFTPNLNLPLPYVDNMLEDDSTRLRTAIGMIDTAIAGRASSATVVALTNTVAQKADLVAGKVPASQLPAFVDDVLEFNAVVAFPAIGEGGKIYVALTGPGADKTYRWSGSAYIEIASSPGSTDVVPEGASNLYHTPARVLDAIPIASPTTLGLVKVGAGLGIDAEGLLYAAVGGGSVMNIQEIVPATNGVSSITVPGGYVAGAIIVIYDGSVLAPTDYVATNGTSITLVSFTAGKLNSFVIVSLATVAIGALPAGTVGTSQLAAGATITNALNAPNQNPKTASTLIANTAFVDQLRSLLPSVSTNVATLADRGSLIQIASDFSIPANVFAANDTFTIYNNSSVSRALYQGGGLTLRKAGSETVGGVNLAGRGLCTIVYISPTEAVISGAGLS